MTTVALIGAQWGSEGKGVIAGGMASMLDAAVRVGGPNAGHSLYRNGELFKMRSVPCAWVGDPTPDLFIGAGAVVHAELLERELAEIAERGGKEVFVKIDPRATIITHAMEEAERGIVASIGSTGEGVGQARIARILRDGSATLAGDYPWDGPIIVDDTALSINRYLKGGGLVMLEGTQGSGLSLLHGTRYPTVTSEDTNVSSLLAAAGIAPSYSEHVHLVARTFPIRVAGPSGPMGEELDWDYFIQRGIIEKPEQTTVTKKIRRVSRWYDPVVDRAVLLNQPCGIWLTFGDYIDPSLRGTTDADAVWESPALRSFVESIQERYGVPVLGVGTGPGVDSRGEPTFSVAHLNHCQHDRSWAWW